MVRVSDGCSDGAIFIPKNSSVSPHTKNCDAQRPLSPRSAVDFCRSTNFISASSEELSKSLRAYVQHDSRSGLELGAPIAIEITVQYRQDL